MEINTASTQMNLNGASSPVMPEEGVGMRESLPLLSRSVIGGVYAAITAVSQWRR